MPKNLLVFLTLSVGTFFHTIAADDVLFSVGDTKVAKSEFEYIYKKNNFNNKADYSRKSLEDYLNLYVNFRLKVKEALAEDLDKNDRFKEELGSYEKQLLDSYIDKDVMEKLLKQEYERSKTDVNISHIFFPAATDGNLTDALAKATEAYKKIKAGTSFEEAATASMDKQSASKGGHIGWFNSYQISLPEVEDVVYNMKPGDVSLPIKTRLGYHVIKLNEVRPARPRLKAAIIKRFFSMTDSSAKAKQMTEDTIRAAYAELKKNIPFEKVVERYSEDELTRNSQGQLDWFGINAFAKVFEDNVYALKDGEYSAPFKTSTAWYIVKRVETAKPLSYDEAVPVLKSKLQNLPQYQYEMDKYIEKLSEKLSVNDLKDNYPALKKRLIMFAEAAPFKYRDTIAPKLLLQIGSKKYNENDFGKQIQDVFYTVYPKAGLDKYDALMKNAAQNFILEYYKNDIRENNREYKALMDEYRNGIMIFSLSEKYIWNKASDDSVGLLTFYNSHKTDFNLKKRATVRTITTDNLKQADALYKLLLTDASATDEVLTAKMKTLGIADPKLNSQVTEEGKTSLNVTVASLNKPIPDGTKYKIVQVYNPQPEKTRAFEECRGYVVAGYQEYLEKKWIDELKLKYPVHINNEIFETLVKK